MPHVDLPQAEFKVVLLGDTFTGKTSLVLRFAEGYYRESARSATVGAFFITKRLTVPSTGLTCKIQIWDTAGQEQFKPLAPMYYQSAAAAILCYDPTSPKSLETLKYWLDELHRNVPAGRIVIAMAACKCDLIAQQDNASSQRQTAAQSTQDGSRSGSRTTEKVSPNKLQTAVAGLQEVEELAAHMGAIFVPTSAKTNDNVTELFAQVAERVLQFQKNNKYGDTKGGGIPVTYGGQSPSQPSSPQQRHNHTGIAPRPNSPHLPPPPPLSPNRHNHTSTISSSSSNNHYPHRYSSASLHSTATAPTGNGTTAAAAMNREDYLHRRNHHYASSSATSGITANNNGSPSRLYTTTDPNKMDGSPITLHPQRSPTNSVSHQQQDNNYNSFSASAATMCGDTDYLNCAALPYASELTGDHSHRCVIL